jgi:nucleotide-binding universal stress UspA family protein
MNELVVGVDGSEESRWALRWAASVAAGVPLPLVVAEAWSGGDPTATDELGEGVKQNLMNFTREVLGESLAGLDTEFVAIRGSAAGALLEQVTPDSGLVLGSRGRGGFAGLLLGSTSRHCVEHAPCPVMVLRQEHPFPATEATILVGHDGSAGGDRALDWAAALARPTGAKVVAAYVWQAGASEVRPRLHQRLTSDAAESIERWAEDTGAEVTPVEVEGEARFELVNLAGRVQADLLVVGRRADASVRALRIGSVASYLVTKSPVPIAVIPPPPESAIS